jgi:hypothetical protein
LAELGRGTAEKHTQSVAIAVSNRDFKVFSLRTVGVAMDLAALKYVKFWEMFLTALHKRPLKGTKDRSLALRRRRKATD